MREDRRMADQQTNEMPDWERRFRAPRVGLPDWARDRPERPAVDTDDPVGLPAAYPSGLAIGRDGLIVVGRTDDEYGAQIHVVTPGAPARLLYEHVEDAGVGDLSEDGTLLAISHSEHGDSRHPAVRVVRVSDGGLVAEKSDGPGKGLTPLAFVPRPGDPRLLLLHERRGREELLLWDTVADTERELALDLPGE